MKLAFSFYSRPGSEKYFVFLGTCLALALASFQISSIILTIDAYSRLYVIIMFFILILKSLLVKLYRYIKRPCIFLVPLWQSPTFLPNACLPGISDPSIHILFRPCLTLSYVGKGGTKCLDYVYDSFWLPWGHNCTPILFLISYPCQKANIFKILQRFFVRW